MPKTEFFIRDRFSRNSDRELVYHDAIAPDITARFALAMIERWALVAGRPDGEDSAGRAKLGLMPPDQIVQQACDVAEAAFAEFAKRDWLVTAPPLSELRDMSEDEPKKLK